jgi:hypothetical protein
METLVSSLARLEARIMEYQKGAGAMADVLPYNRAWYAIKREKGWLFGPSKFVGYDDLTAEQYMEGASENLDGRVTEGVLGKWSELVEEGHPKYEELHAALSKFCAHFGKKPNSRARISLVRPSKEASTTEPMYNDELVALMAAVYRKLTPAQKSAFRKQAAA